MATIKEVLIAEQQAKAAYAHFLKVMLAHNMRLLKLVVQHKNNPEELQKILAELQEASGDRVHGH